MSSGLDLFAEASAAALGGVCSTVSLYPLEIVKNKMPAGEKGSVAGTCVVTLPTASAGTAKTEKLCMGLQKMNRRLKTPSSRNDFQPTFVTKQGIR